MLQVMLQVMELQNHMLSVMYIKLDVTDLMSHVTGYVASYGIMKSHVISEVCYIRCYRLYVSCCRLCCKLWRYEVMLSVRNIILDVTDCMSHVAGYVMSYGIMNSHVISEVYYIRC